MDTTSKFLIISIIGIALLLLSLLIPPKEINSEEELQSLSENQNVYTQSKIDSISTTSSFTYLSLENGIVIKTNKEIQFLKGRTIQIRGIAEFYEEKVFLKANKIVFINNFIYFKILKIK